jgi:hypothetical protein
VLFGPSAMDTLDSPNSRRWTRAGDGGFPVEFPIVLVVSRWLNDTISISDRGHLLSAVDECCSLSSLCCKCFLPPPSISVGAQCWRRSVLTHKTSTYSAWLATWSSYRLGCRVAIVTLQPRRWERIGARSLPKRCIPIANFGSLSLGQD